MKTISICDAGRDFDELLAQAIAGEPQVILRGKIKTAVLISYDDYLKLTAKKNDSLVDFLLNSPLRNSGIDFSRFRQETGSKTLKSG